MNSWKMASFFLGIILIISFVNASEPVLRILKDSQKSSTIDGNQENSICKQERDLFKEYSASTIENANDLYYNCDCYADNKDLTEARDCYMKVKDHCDSILKTNPSDPKTLDLKTYTTDRINELDGDIYKSPPGSNCTCVKNSDYNSIIAGYDNITRLDPNNIKAWNNRGALLGELCCVEEAKASFDEAISINSSLAEPWYNKGVCFFQDNPQEALRCFNRSIELDPGLAEAWFNRYPLLIHSDINMSSSTYRLAYKEAVASYSKAIELNPDLGLYKPPYLIYRRMG